MIMGKKEVKLDGVKTKGEKLREVVLIFEIWNILNFEIQNFKFGLLFKIN